MGCSTITIRNTSGTDHLSFDRVGLPGFQFIQDDIEYDRGYHTVMDTLRKACDGRFETKCSNHRIICIQCRNAERKITWKTCHETEAEYQSGAKDVTI